MWSGERLTKVQATTRLDNVWPDAWTKIGKAAQKREKQEWKNEKPKLDNARRLRGIYFIDPDEEENKDIIKNARRKLEVRMDASMLCKKTRKKTTSSQETGSRRNVHRTPCRTHFSHAHSLSGSVVRWSSITHFPCTCVAQDEAVCIFQNSSYFSQHVVHYTRVDQQLLTLHLHSFLSFGKTYLNFPDFPYSSEINPCHHPQQASVGYMADVRTCTGYEPSSRCSSTGLVFLRLTILLRALRHLLQNRIWMMSKFVLCWLHSCTCRRERQVRTVSSSSQVPKSTGEPVALFSSRRKLS